MCLPGTVEAVRERIEEESGPRLDRRTVIVGGAAAAIAAAFPIGASARPAKKRFMDLTHTFRAGFPVFVPGEEPQRETIANYTPDGFYAQRWTFGEHSGTHLDVPGHFVADGRRVTALRPKELILPIVVIDISRRAASDPDAVVTPDDITRFERRHGRIANGALIAMDSGWASKVGDDAAFKGGPAGAYHFPGFGEDAIDFLLARRRAAAIGVDTLSLDPGNSATFPVHVKWLGADNFGIENLRNLDKLPPHGATAIVGVIPWEEGSGGPARVLATY